MRSLLAGFFRGPVARGGGNAGRNATLSLRYLQFCGRSRSKANPAASKWSRERLRWCPRRFHIAARDRQCLRVRVATQEFVTEGVDPEKPTTQNKFAVRPSEPMGSANGGNGAAAGEGPVLEHISFWDPQSDLWVERDVAALIGCKREGGRVVKKLSAFNYFTGMTGKGGARAPILYNGKEFRVDVYNLEEEQNGFPSRLRRRRDLVSVSRPFVESHRVGRARPRPGADDLHTARRRPSDHRQSRLSPDGALQSQAGSSQGF